MVATTSAEGKRRLAPMHFNQPSVESAASVVTFCVDLNRFVRWCEASDAVPGFDNVRYPGAVNERFSEVLLDYIRPFLGGKC